MRELLVEVKQMLVGLMRRVGQYLNLTPAPKTAKRCCKKGCKCSKKACKRSKR